MALSPASDLSGYTRPLSSITIRNKILYISRNKLECNSIETLHVTSLPMFDSIAVISFALSGLLRKPVPNILIEFSTAEARPLLILSPDSRASR